MTLSQRLKRAVEFDENLSWDEEDALDELERARLRGAYLEHARLQPLLEALCAVARAADKMVIIDPHLSVALQALERVLPKDGE